MTKVKFVHVLLLVFPVLSFSQDEGLNLFQATERAQSDQDSRTPQRSSTTSQDPAFTLVGTSRFGEKYYASLLSRSGDSVRVEWETGIVKNIEGYSGYGIADVNSRSVSLRLPSSETCISNELKGVRCNGNFAVLTLSNADPMKSNSPINNVNVVSQSDNAGQITTEGLSSEESQEEKTTIGDTDVLIRNPFSGELQTVPDLAPEQIATREERRQRRAEQFRNFEIVRIPDDEVPVGMQRVRSPFGDSLEPIED